MPQTVWANSPLIPPSPPGYLQIWNWKRSWHSLQICFVIMQLERSRKYARRQSKRGNCSLLQFPLCFCWSHPPRISFPCEVFPLDLRLLPVWNVISSGLFPDPTVHYLGKGHGHQRETFIPGIFAFAAFVLTLIPPGAATFPGYQSTNS